MKEYFANPTNKIVAIVATVVVLVTIFLYFFWPTPWKVKYKVIEYERSYGVGTEKVKTQIRRNVITGTVCVIRVDGNWEYCKTRTGKRTSRDIRIQKD